MSSLGAELYVGMGIDPEKPRPALLTFEIVTSIQDLCPKYSLFINVGGAIRPMFESNSLVYNDDYSIFAGYRFLDKLFWQTDNEVFT